MNMRKHEDGSLHAVHFNGPGNTEKEVLSKERMQRRRFWDADHFFKCPLVGMCLTASESKQLLKKAGYSLKGKSSFEIHETLVASSDSENRLSRKVDSLLSRKFEQQTVNLYRLEERDFLEHWRSCFLDGDFRGFLWVAASRADLSVAARREIFGAVHMAMHGNADRIAKLKQRLAREQTKNRRDSQRCETEMRARKSLQKEKAALEGNLRRLHCDLTAMGREKAKMANELAWLRSAAHQELERENDRLRAELAESSRRLKQFAAQLAHAERENQRLSIEWDKQQDLNAQIRDEMEGVVRQFTELGECSINCPTFDLCRKRILIVGGVTRMESLYRRLIEAGGGILEYHDGNMKNGLKNLEGRLRRADLVLCPVNCNSHAACSMVKKLGKKYNKPVRMLSNSSLSGISQVIWGSSGAGGQSNPAQNPFQSNN